MVSIYVLNRENVAEEVGLEVDGLKSAGWALNAEEALDSRTLGIVEVFGILQRCAEDGMSA